MIPIVTGVGEAVRALRFTDKMGNTLEIAEAVDFTKDARDIIKSLEHTNGFTKSTRSAGRKIHKGYKSGPAFKAEYKEYKKVKGIRPDYYNPKTKTIYELKPYNPRSAKAGVKQLKKYKKKIGKRSNVRLEFY